MSSVLLFIGRIWARVASSEGDQTAFELETATAVCGVRRTSFTAAVGADGATRVGVEEGLVTVEADQQKVDVPAGGETTVEFGPEKPSIYPYIRSEENWENWRREREQIFIARADTLVQEMMRGVTAPRKNLYAQDKKESWRMPRRIRINTPPNLFKS